MSYVTLGPLDGEFIQSSLHSLSIDAFIARNTTPEPLILHPGMILTEVEDGIVEPMTADDTAATPADAINIKRYVLQPGEITPITAVSRIAEVTAKRLIWPESITPVQQQEAVAAFKDNYIILR